MACAGTAGRVCRPAWHDVRAAALPRVWPADACGPSIRPFMRVPVLCVLMRVSAISSLTVTSLAMAVALAVAMAVAMAVALAVAVALALRVPVLPVGIGVPVLALGMRVALRRGPGR